MDVFDSDLDLTYGGDRLMFFNVEEPFTLSLSEFEEKWKEVDNVCVQVGSTKILRSQMVGLRPMIVDFEKDMPHLRRILKLQWRRGERPVKDILRYVSPKSQLL